MTVVARKFISVPVRSARETWRAICGILAADSNSAAARELLSVSGVASSLIAREAMTSPIVVHGSGPRVRIYCLYHADAIDGDDSNESDLIFDATDGDWKMSLPCPTDDLDWVRAELAGKTKRITARDSETKLDEEDSDKNSAQSFVLKLDREAFFRP